MGLLDSTNKNFNQAGTQKGMRIAVHELTGVLKSQHMQIRRKISAKLGLD